MPYPVSDMKLARRAACFLLKYRYNRSHTKQANQVLKVLQREGGRLDPELVRVCNSYASDVLGSKAFAPWLQVYAAVAGEFREGWIPDNYYGLIVVPRLKGVYGSVANRKALARRLFSSTAFPDIAYQVNGAYFDVNGSPISRGHLAQALFRESEQVVFKAEGSSQGRSVLVLRAQELNVEQLDRLGNGVFQTYVVQHPFFDKFASNSVATIRVTTAIDDSGTPGVRASYLRLARQADTHVRSASHVRVSVNPRTGRLDDHGYLATWEKIDRHPDSGERFEGAVIPNFEHCLETIVELHGRLPFARVVGWDAIVDRDGAVQIMEWNGGHNDIKFSEATQGPCFSDLGWERLFVTAAPASREWVEAARHDLCRGAR